MSVKKVTLGQFFTKEAVWLKPQIIDFIKRSNCSIAYDPFAGGGDLLNVCQKSLNIKNIIGLDIDESLQWNKNDSLVKIPHIDNAFIITNPPYLAKQSATRKKLDLSKYFNNSLYDDLYLIALDKMLEAQDYVVVIVPESFINSSFKKKHLLSSVTVLEENPFLDTENPVCVLCFDNIPKEFTDIKIYKNDLLVGTLKEIFNLRINPNNSVRIIFNDSSGWLGLRAVDSTDDKKFIHFDYKENFKYDWSNKIKHTSRHFSLININIPNNKKACFIDECNKILFHLRGESDDILLTPFKGNTKKGIRRRRLDFKLARAIMEQAYITVNSKKDFENE
ncbi:Eco57I restriction-modification methylase domain-containing protein [Mycoplasmopsis felifaucium]|uniref:Eco57I restriction-modification methylase domain-containing protein n=1 Tax=Mycoplasmopsis felifaucium TaxID=35768 RepID=UPI00048725A8|nr:hypothetical protein [Mycoplasmopsis felifaucium]